MKHLPNIVIAAIALLTGACTGEHDAAWWQQQNRQARPIAMTAYTPQPTRSSADYTAEGGIPRGQSMGVYAYLHDKSTWTATAQPNFMWNQQAVSPDDGDDCFGYAPLKYWPNDENDKVSFMAYFPYTTYNDPTDPTYLGNATGLQPLLNNDGTGLPTFKFRVKDKEDEQVDFLVSDLIVNLPQTRDTEGDPNTAFNDLSIGDRVNFYFRHMTAKVEFRVVVDPSIRNDLSHFHLNSLSISNISSEGTLTPTYDALTGTHFAWGSYDRTHKYYCKTYHSYLLLPQTLSDEAKLSASFTMTFRSSGTTYKYKDGGTTPDPTQEYTYEISNAQLQLNKLKVTGTDEPLTEWLPNHHYVYTIRLGAHRIDFTGQVAEWGEMIWLPL